MPEIDAFATESHYLAHLAPIWHALDPAERGTFWVAGALGDRPAREGVAPIKIGFPTRSSTPTLVASFQDRRHAAHVGRPVVYLEHGAGQTYLGDPRGDHPSYSGGPEHEGTALFLSPSETVADRWRARYPTPAIAVGCPKLDVRHCRARETVAPLPTVALSFHSAVALCPETQTAYPHFSGGLRDAVGALRAQGVDVLGHGHPRLWGRLRAVWAALDVEAVEDFDEILGRADVYACDNSSTLPEAASVGLRLVWLNAPWYRRDINHGGRFWEWPRGQVSCDHPADLADAVMETLDEPVEVFKAREAMVREVYVAIDGNAAARSVEAIRAIVLDR